MAHNGQKDSRYLSSDEVISSAMMALGLTDDSMRNIFREWAYLGVRYIGVNHTNIEKKTFDIVDLSFGKPCNMIKPIAVKLFIKCDDQSADNCIIPLFQEDEYRDACTTDVGVNNISVREQLDQFVISSNGRGYLKAEVKFYGIPVDDKDQPLIPEYYQRACMAFIEYMYTKRMRNRDRKNIPMSDVAYLDKKWQQLKADATSYKNQPSDLQASEIARSWQTLLPNQRRMKRDRSRTFYSTGYY